jgi:hypothetical protein
MSIGSLVAVMRAFLSRKGMTIRSLSSPQAALDLEDEVAVLRDVIDLVSDASRLSPPNWDDEKTVEISPDKMANIVASSMLVGDTI